MNQDKLEILTSVATELEKDNNYGKARIKELEKENNGLLKENIQMYKDIESINNQVDELEEDLKICKRIHQSMIKRSKIIINERKNNE